MGRHLGGEAIGRRHLGGDIWECIWEETSEKASEEVLLERLNLQTLQSVSCSHICIVFGDSAEIIPRFCWDSAGVLFERLILQILQSLVVQIYSLFSMILLRFCWDSAGVLFERLIFQTLQSISCSNILFVFDDSARIQ